MAFPKNPTSEKWEGRPTPPIPCNPRDISRGLHGIGGVAASDILNDPIPAFTGWRGLLDLANRCHLRKPAQLRVGVERVCRIVVGWPRLLRGARQGSQLRRI